MVLLAAGPGRYLAAGGIGLAAGATLGVVGWGGAQVIKPTLTSPLLGCTHLQATATSLFSLSVAVVSGASQFVGGGSASLTLAAAIALPSMAGARWGSRLAGRLSPDALALIFNGGSVMLLPTHFWIQNRRRAQQQEADEAQLGPLAAAHHDESDAATEAGLAAATAQLLEPAALAGHCAFGFGAGVLSALMGVGGLPVVMSYLTIASPLPHHLIQGTAMCAVAPSVLTSSLTHVQSGATPLRVAAAVTCGSVTGAALVTYPRLTLRLMECLERANTERLLFGAHRAPTSRCRCRSSGCASSSC